MSTVSPTVSFTVKVLVDGAWESAGHFRSPEKADKAARLLSERLNRPVAIRDASGLTIAEHFPQPCDGETSRRAPLSASPYVLSEVAVAAHG